MKVLVVDDEFISRLVLHEMLLPYGLVHVAAHGAEALEGVRLAHEMGAPYDVIFMDLLMPIMSGQQALDAIRLFEKSRGIPASGGCKVILVTGLHAGGESGGVGQKMLRQMITSCDGHLEKPVNKKALAGLMRGLGGDA
jgi:two-component system, chemotaxis family, chemotaxis protein CheY